MPTALKNPKQTINTEKLKLNIVNANIKCFKKKKICLYKNENSITKFHVEEDIETWN